MEQFKSVTTQGQPAKRNLLTVDQAWDKVFERSISKTKLYQMLQQGLIPCVKIGAKYLMRRDTLEQWMHQQEQENCTSAR